MLQPGVARCRGLKKKGDQPFNDTSSHTQSEASLATMLVPIALIICMRDLGTSICRRRLKLTQKRREVNRPQRVDGCFPTSFRTEALHTRILVCLKHRLEACFSDAFGEIFQLHIAPRERSNLQKECLDPPHHLNRGPEKLRCALAGIRQDKSTRGSSECFRQVEYLDI